MPQLMPLFWMMSFMMVLLLLLVGFKMYFNSIEKLDNDQMLSVMVKSWLW